MCEEYELRRTSHFSEYDNIHRVLRPILCNYARRLLFSVDRTVDCTVDEIIDELIGELLELQTRNSVIFGLRSSGVTTSSLLQPLVAKLPDSIGCVLEASWRGSPLAQRSTLAFRHVAGPAPHLAPEVLTEYLSVIAPPLYCLHLSTASIATASIATASNCSILYCSSLNCLSTSAPAATISEPLLQSLPPPLPMSSSALQ